MYTKLNAREEIPRSIATQTRHFEFRQCLCTYLQLEIVKKVVPKFELFEPFMHCVHIVRHEK